MRNTIRIGIVHGHLAGRAVHDAVTDATIALTVVAALAFDRNVGQAFQTRKTIEAATGAMDALSPGEHDGDHETHTFPLMTPLCNGQGRPRFSCGSAVRTTPLNRERGAGRLWA